MMKIFKNKKNNQLRMIKLMKLNLANSRMNNIQKKWDIRN